VPIIAHPRHCRRALPRELGAGRTVSRAVADIEEALQRTEGNFTVGLALEGEMRLFDEIEEVGAL